MIKAEDLRIGDLVRVNCDCAFPEGSVCIVTQINPERTYKEKKGVVTLSYVDGTDDGPWGVWCSNIEGIPLTPEILEKNGWLFSPRLSSAYAREDNRLEVHFYPQSEWMHVIFGSETLHKIRYVHELQHILWSLGLDAQMTYPSLPILDIEAFQAQVEELDDELSNRILEDLNENK